MKKLEGRSVCNLVTLNSQKEKGFVFLRSQRNERNKTTKLLCIKRKGWSVLIIKFERKKAKSDSMNISTLRQLIYMHIISCQ